MGRVAPPPTVPHGSTEPSNRWLWVGGTAIVLAVALSVVFFFLNQAYGSTINAEGTPTPNAVPGVVSPSPTGTPTVVAAASPASKATPQPSPSPSPSPEPSPTSPSSPTPVPPTPTQAPATAPAAAAPSPSPGQTEPSPTTFSGQVSPAGGLGNTRSDIDAAYGGPVGETPDHLAVYRKDNFEYHILLVPDLNGRAAAIVQLPQASSAATMTLEQAQTAAHRLLPRDTQPPNAASEGNPQFVVERFTSQALTQALPPEAFSAGGGQPGQFLIVYARDPQGSVTRWIIGAGDDPNALLNLGR